jgi:hypothetical protein
MATKGFVRAIPVLTGKLNFPPGNRESGGEIRLKSSLCYTAREAKREDPFSYDIK